MKNLELLSAAEIGREVNAGHISPTEVVRFFEERIEAHNKDLNAFVYTKFEYAEDAAKLATAVACIKCTRIGGRAGIPDRATAEKFMETGEIDYTEIDQRTAFYGKGLQL